MKIWIIRISGSAGSLLSLASLSYASGLGPELPLQDLPDYITPASAAAAGTVLLDLYLLLSSGYKRLPFWSALFTANVFMIWALRDTGIASFSPGTAALIAGGGVLFAAARTAEANPVISTRRFFLTALTAVTVVFGTLYILEIEGHIVSRPLFYPAGFHQFLSLLPDEAMKYRDELISYFERKGKDRLTREEEHALTEELSRRIEDLEADRKRFEEVRAKNLALEREIEQLHIRLRDMDLPVLSEDDLQKVATYNEAVRPDSPLVRDFAVGIASEYPGPYSHNTGSPVPGRNGIRQILSLHRYISGRWRYVNDPLFIETDYYSPADRTIAAGLSGDCDDFAILLTACVEAVGGGARILHGTCADGGHAWCEVYIGNASAWREALAVCGELYPGRTISCLTPRGADDYWLSLDWQAGAYSCAEEPVIAYQSGWRDTR